MEQTTDLIFKTRSLLRAQPLFPEIRKLLAQYELDLDNQIEYFVLAFIDNQLVACAGLDHNVIKCIAVDPILRNTNISLTLINEVTNLAAEKGYHHLFLYTKPDNIHFFKGCGFYPITTVPTRITLMENTPVGIAHYCRSLKAKRQPGNKTGAIVMNANPFTLGHRYLIEAAAQLCDWLHIFVVRENLSQFTYEDRLSLVRQGSAGIEKVTIHEGSGYLISKATFPDYFIKEKQDIEATSTALDILIFREHIAPALNITHRFVGKEPFCAVTAQYNKEMAYWLQQPDIDAPAVTLIELERTKTNEGLIISASEVRKAIAEHDNARIRSLVPLTTWDFLLKKQLVK